MRHSPTFINHVAEAFGVQQQFALSLRDETEIADAIKHHDLLFCEKPARSSILAAMLARAFATTEATETTRKRLATKD